MSVISKYMEGAGIESKLGYVGTTLGRCPGNISSW